MALALEYGSQQQPLVQGSGSWVAHPQSWTWGCGSSILEFWRDFLGSHIGLPWDDERHRSASPNLARLNLYSISVRFICDVRHLCFLLPSRKLLCLCHNTGVRGRVNSFATIRGMLLDPTTCKEQCSMEEGPLDHLLLKWTCIPRLPQLPTGNAAQDVSPIDEVQFFTWDWNCSWALPQGIDLRTETISVCPVMVLPDLRCNPFLYPLLWFIAVFPWLAES